jgi:hypothetical protein
MDLHLIRRIERAALVLGGVAVLLSTISLDPAVIVGVFIGAAVGWLNFLVVRALSERAAANPDRKNTVIGVVMVKLAVLIGVVMVLVLVFGVHGVGFIAGFSAAVLAVISVPILDVLGGRGVPGTDSKSDGPSPGGS